MKDLNRRDFIIASAATFSACVCCPLQAAARRGKQPPVDAGAISRFDRDGIYDHCAKEHSFFIIRESGRLYAVSATCTHRRFGLVLDDGEMKCPKHGSIFDVCGKPMKAPARKPLPRYGIRCDERKHVIVDRSREFAEKQWNDPESFVAV